MIGVYVIIYSARIFRWNNIHILFVISEYFIVIEYYIKFLLFYECNEKFEVVSKNVFISRCWHSHRICVTPQNRNGGNVRGWMTSCQISQHMQYSNQSTTTIALIMYKFLHRCLNITYSNIKS